MVSQPSATSWKARRKPPTATAPPRPPNIQSSLQQTNISNTNGETRGPRVARFLLQPLPHAVPALQEPQPLAVSNTRKVQCLGGYRIPGSGADSRKRIADSRQRIAFC